MSNFILKCINGDALLTEIDDYIELWHDSGSDLSLHKFLGMTQEEYAFFVEDEHYLATIITDRIEKNNLIENK